jgi:predicted nucleotidyltransferase
VLPDATKQLVEPIVDWASNQPKIKELWLVGSRVRGDHLPDGDLDIVLITSMPKSEAFNFFFWGQADTLGTELSDLIGVRGHLLQGDETLQTDEVAKTLATDSVRIFTRVDSAE